MGAVADIADAASDDCLVAVKSPKLVPTRHTKAGAIMTVKGPKARATLSIMAEEGE